MLLLCLKKPATMNKKGVLIVLLFSSTSYADQWSIDGRIKQDFAYDDNVRMLQSPKGSIEYKLTSMLNLSHKTDTSLLYIETSYGIQRYLAMSELDRALQHHKIGGNYSTEKSDWSIVASMNIAPSRNTAVEDSGNFDSNAQKTIFSISPSVSYHLTELDTLGLNTHYSQTTYSTTNFSSNLSHLVSLDWQRQWTERYSSSVSFSHSSFQSSNTNLNTKLNSQTYNINLSSTYLLSEQWKLFTVVGGRITFSENSLAGNGMKSQSKGFLINSGISYKGESSSSQLGFKRSLMPSSQGQLQEQNKLNLNLSYHFTEHLTTSVTASYQLTNRSATNGEKNSRENIILQPSINWHFLQDWTMNGSYRYRSQKSAGTQNKEVASNLFMLTISYNWDELNLSR